MTESVPVVDRAAFAHAMAALGPFESRPHLACAVSGGADSMALALLASEWAAARGGAVVALIVDHGLRPESADEARRVADLLAARAIPARILVRGGGRPASGLQARAREDRYRLLAERCRADGILHLLIGHHRDDQAETYLLRLGRGSGVDGLAAMAPLRERPEVRLLRPLLSFGKARLVATCRAAGADWIEDPSNGDDAFARVRMRRMLPALADAGLGAEGLAQATAGFARVRVALEGATARLLARAARIHPAGFARLDFVALRAADEDIALRATAAVARAIGGGSYPPSPSAVARAFAKLSGAAAAATTLAGCRLILDANGLLICREAGRPGPSPLAALPGVHAWDRRFRLELLPGPGAAAGALRISHLGAAGWREIAGTVNALGGCRLPRPVLAALPALCDDAGVAAVPHLDFNRPGPGFGVTVAGIRFVPPNPAAPAGFFVVA